MRRVLVAGFLALAPFTLPATAAPPPPPPALPEGTPETVDGFYTSAMYSDFVGWLQDEADAAITERQARDIARLTGPAFTQLLSLHIHADWYFRDVAGGLERICTSHPRDFDINVVGSNHLTHAEIAEHCYWQVRLIDGPQSEQIALSYQGAAFDPVRAAAHLRAQGVSPDTELYKIDVDWSGYQNGDAFRTNGLRTRTWTSRTCDAFAPALAKLESLETGPVDVPGFGSETKKAHGIPHSSRLEVTVFTVLGGNDAKITLEGSAGMARSIVTILDGIVGGCAPE